MHLFHVQTASECRADDICIREPDALSISASRGKITSFGSPDAIRATELLVKLNDDMRCLPGTVSLGYQPGESDTRHCNVTGGSARGDSGGKTFFTVCSVSGAERVFPGAPREHF